MNDGAVVLAAMDFDEITTSQICCLGISKDRHDG